MFLCPDVTCSNHVRPRSANRLAPMFDMRPCPQPETPKAADGPELVGGLEHFFPTYWECHHPDLRTHIFQGGRSTTNQRRSKLLRKNRGFSRKMPQIEVFPPGTGTAVQHLRQLCNMCHGQWDGLQDILSHSSSILFYFRIFILRYSITMCYIVLLIVYVILYCIS